MTATDTPRDEKAGWSSYCRPGNHDTCKSVGAKCACPCHDKEARKRTCSNCLRGNHGGCTTTTCAHHGCDTPRPPIQLVEETGSFVCGECDASFPSPQSLGAHRRYKHGQPGGDRTPPAAKGGKKPQRPILIELVDEEPPPPPPPPAPKKKPAELIVDLVEGADLAPGVWKRCALFHSPQSAKRMATRLATESAGYEWQASNDGRLFVRLPEAG